MESSKSWEITEWCPLPGFIEIETDAPQGSTDQEIIFCPAVRCHTSVIPLDKDHLTLEIGITHAYLRLDLQNVSVKKRSKLSDAQKRILVPVSVESESNSDFDISASTKNISENKLSFKLGRSRHLKTSQKDELQTRIRALSDNEWLISEVPLGLELNGRYTGDESLCILEVNDVPFVAVLNIEFYPRDLLLKEIYDDRSMAALRSKLSSNKLKLVSLLITKGLMEQVRRGRKKLTHMTRVCVAKSSLISKEEI